jgi:hypothetical protein
MRGFYEIKTEHGHADNVKAMIVNRLIAESRDCIFNTFV